MASAQRRATSSASVTPLVDHASTTDGTSGLALRRTSNISYGNYGIYASRTPRTSAAVATAGPGDAPPSRGPRRAGRSPAGRAERNTRRHLSRHPPAAAMSSRRLLPSPVDRGGPPRRAARRAPVGGAGPPSARPDVARRRTRLRRGHPHNVPRTDGQSAKCHAIGDMSLRLVYLLSREPADPARTPAPHPASAHPQPQPDPRPQPDHGPARPQPDPSRAPAPTPPARSRPLLRRRAAERERAARRRSPQDRHP